MDFSGTIRICCKFGPQMAQLAKDYKGHSRRYLHTLGQNPIPHSPPPVLLARHQEHLPGEGGGCVRVTRLLQPQDLLLQLLNRGTSSSDPEAATCAQLLLL